MRRRKIRCEACAVSRDAQGGLSLLRRTSSIAWDDLSNGPSAGGRGFAAARQVAVVPELGRNFLNQPVVIATFPRQRNGNGCSTLSFTQGAMRWVRHAPPLAPFNWTSGAVIVPAGSWLRLAHADWPDEALRLMHATSWKAPRSTIGRTNREHP